MRAAADDSVRNRRMFASDTATETLSTPVTINTQQHTPPIKSLNFMFAASAASAFSVIVGSPFDSLKVRMQTQHYNSAADCIRQTMRAEGVRGFFRGIIPPLMTVNLVKTISVGVYENSRIRLSRLLDSSSRPTSCSTTDSLFSNSLLSSTALPQSKSLIYFLSGCMAGISTSLLSSPLELIRNQRILHDAKVISLRNASTVSSFPSSSSSSSSSLPSSSSSSSIGKTAVNATINNSKPPTLGFSTAIRKTTTFEYAKVMVQTNGILGGLYRGFSMHFIRETLGTGTYWLIYESLHRLTFISPTGNRRDANGWGRFMAGGLTGMLAWSLVFPLDLLKNVYQREASVPRQDRVYGSIGECARTVYRRSGWRGFYQGLWPTMWRAFPIHAINLFVYEFFLELLD